MSIRGEHRFKFSGPVIAEAAERRAGELLDELDETTVADLRALLEEQIGERIDEMVANRAMGFNAMSLNGPDPTHISIHIPVEAFQAYARADIAFREKKHAASELIAAAARYRTQDEFDDAFMLAAEDVRHFGLDR